MALLIVLFTPAMAVVEVPSGPSPSGFDLATLDDPPPSADLTVTVPRCGPDPAQTPGGIVICGAPTWREPPPPPPAPATANPPPARKRFDASNRRQCSVVQSAKSCFEGWVVYHATF